MPGRTLARRRVLPFFALLAALALPAAAHAQAPGDLTQAPAVLADTSKLARGLWVVDLYVGLGLAQSAYSDNWKTGDKGSLAWVANLGFEAERQFSDTFNWYNVSKLAYGETANQIDDPDHPGENKWAKPEKTNDLIYLESVGRFTLGGFVDPYAAFRLDSYFSDESSPLGSIRTPTGRRPSPIVRRRASSNQFGSPTR